MGNYTELNDKRVLVTGASSGIGAGIARAFGANGAAPSLPIGLYAMIHSLSSLDL